MRRTILQRQRTEEDVDRYVHEVLSTDYGRCSSCGAFEPIGFIYDEKDPRDFVRASERLQACGWTIKGPPEASWFCPPCARAVAGAS